MLRLGFIAAMMVRIWVRLHIHHWDMVETALKR